MIIDTWQRIRRPRKRNEDLYAYDVEQGAQLQKLAFQHHVTIVCVHHQRKATADTILDTISGSEGIAATADCIWVLERRSLGGAGAVLSITGRDVEEQELGLARADGVWSLVGSGEELRRGENERSIVNLLREERRAMSPGDVAKKLKKDGDAVRVALNRLARRGVIQNPARGLYSAR